ncbi:DUF3718 domain-containing protein [Bowmanella denitrificans]|uniref:DUF3718 domain-containing protein n=1 Tax=Bowmanella denitrificans TaxID=366582 RepID=UPI001559552F|nr:DUF3718 domain-containing protein [Bowmanella denitrificans]
MHPLNKLMCATLLLGPTVVSAKTIYVAADDSLTSKLCVSAATDAPVNFHLQQKQSGLKLRVISEKVSCNGSAIGDFAYQAGNLRVARQLNRLNPQATYTEIKDIAEVPRDNKVRIIQVSGE